MAATSADTLILRHHTYSESSLVVTALSREHGRMDFLAKGCRREKSPLFGHLDLYQREEVFFYSRPLANLDLLTEAYLVDEYAGLRFFPPAFAAAGFLAELALAACMPADPHPELFDSLAGSFNYMSRLGEPAAKAGLVKHSGMPTSDKMVLLARILRLVTLQTLSLFGFAPRLDACVICGRAANMSDNNRVSRSHGGLICPSCSARAGGSRISKNVLEALLAAAEGREYEENRLSGSERRELLRFLVDYCQYVIEKPLHSAKPLFQLVRL
jgi:Recombinational DNA repair protein (RecF pathway)